MGVLHIYCYGDCEWLVGETPEDAERAAHEQCGWQKDCYDEPPVEEPDDACMGIWLDEKTGEISDGGLFAWGQMSVWAEEFGPGFLCSTEY